MTNLQKILNSIKTLGLTNISATQIAVNADLTLTQITEAVRPAIKSGEVIKTGKGNAAEYSLPEEIETSDDKEVISLSSLCEKHDINPMIARRKLRKANVTKPGKQWSWAQDFDLSGIIEIITK